MMAFERLTNVFQSVRGKVIAGSVAAMVAFSPVAATQADAQDMSAQPTVSEQCTWENQELCELRGAADAARNYAESHPGVGILIHVGQDFPNAHFENADQFGRAFVNAFAQHGVDARYFLRQNNVHNTGLTFYIGPYIHGQNNGTEVKNVMEAMDAIPAVARELDIINNGAASAPGETEP